MEISYIIKLNNYKRGYLSFWRDIGEVGAKNNELKAEYFITLNIKNAYKFSSLEEAYKTMSYIFSNRPISEVGILESISTEKSRESWIFGYNPTGILDKNSKKRLYYTGFDGVHFPLSLDRKEAKRFNSLNETIKEVQQFFNDYAQAIAPETYHSINYECNFEKDEVISWKPLDKKE